MNRDTESMKSSSTGDRRDKGRHAVPDGRRLSLALLGITGVIAVLATGAYGAAVLWADRLLGPSPSRVAEVFVSMRLHGFLAICCGMMFLLVRRRRSCPRAWARVCLVGTTVAALVSFDRLAGTVFPPPSTLNDILEPHPIRGWAHRRNAVGSSQGVQVRTNALGFRGADSGTVPDKRDGELRVLFLGDSVTYGYLLENHATFASQTERLLREPHGDTRYVCFNAGVGGYATWQEFELLKDVGVRVSPDLVVLQFCFNDVSDLIYWDPDKISGLELPFEFSNVDHWSGLVRAGRSVLARRRFDSTRAKIGFANTNLIHGTDDRLRSLDHIYREPLVEPVRDAWELEEAHLDKFDQWCRSNDLPWVFIAFPMRSQLESFDPAIHPQQRLADWAARSKANYIDLLPVYRKHLSQTGHQPRDMMHDDIHPSALGNRIAAEALVQYAQEHGLIR